MKKKLIFIILVSLICSSFLLVYKKNSVPSVVQTGENGLPIGYKKAEFEDKRIESVIIEANETKYLDKNNVIVKTSPYGFNDSLFE